MTETKKKGQREKRHYKMDTYSERILSIEIKMDGSIATIISIYSSIWKHWGEKLISSWYYIWQFDVLRTYLDCSQFSQSLSRISFYNINNGYSVVVFVSRGGVLKVLPKWVKL